MALIPGTLPNDTCYGSPQDLLELFAQYLDIPAVSINVKVSFSATAPADTSSIWFDTAAGVNPILKIYVPSSWVDYIRNYTLNAVTTAPVSTDFFLFSDTSDSGNMKKGLVSQILAKAIQIVEGSTTTSVANTSTTLADTGLTVSITPTSSANKVLILIVQNTELIRSGIAAGVLFKVLRGATALYTGALDNYINVGGASDVQMRTPWCFQYLDTPATVAATTYKVQGRVQTAGSGATVTFQANSSRSSILAIEVTP